MAVTLFRPNLEVIQEQAQQAREAEKKRKDDNGFKWGDFELGDTFIRLLPPTNSRGILWKKVSTHYFNQVHSLKDINKQICVANSFPEVTGVRCHICDTGDRLLAMMPQLDIKSWHRPSDAYYVQALNKTIPDDNVARLYRLTPHLKNRIAQDMESSLKENVDITDLQYGLDLKIVKTEKPAKNKKMITNYECSLWSLKGPAPLHPDPAIAQAIINSMVDPDKIWKMPEDAALADIRTAAGKIMNYYQRESYSHPGAQIQAPGMTSGAQSPQSQPAVQSQSVVHSQPVIQQPAQSQPAVQSVAQPIVQQYQPAVQQSLPAVDKAADAVNQIANIAAAQPVIQQSSPAVQQVAKPASGPAPTQNRSPTDKPVCFAAAAPRKDGGYGYNDESEVCLMCPHELACMDACSKIDLVTLNKASA